MQATRPEMLTVGHSTRPPGELERLLCDHEVQTLADVRAHPGSRRMPHFASEPLRSALEAAGIAYLHVPALGGRRSPRSDSPNGAWMNRGFQGYADHMESDEFAAGLEQVMRAGRECRTCVMCAEAAWWRCHRRLVADALVVGGWRVLHLTGSGQPAEHELTDFAVVDGERIRYPPPQGSLGL